MTQVLIGAVLLYFGAEFLIKGSKSIAIKFNISPIIIGITLVAVGTSLPELIVSILANLKGEPGIVIGNVMGSNVANIGLVLGITAILSPIYIPFAKIRYDMYFLMGITILSLWFIIMGNLVFWQGIVLLLLLIIYCVYIFKNNKLEIEENKVEISLINLLLLGQVMIGVLGLALGAILLVEGAQGIAFSLGVSSLVIGMSIVALGTSLPELAASLAAIKHGESGMVIGNVIGSNIINIVLVLGFTICVGNIQINYMEIIFQGFFMFFSIVILFLLIKTNDRITKLSGIFLTMIYIVFLFFNFQTV